MAKTKRSPKQRANDKRLGLMAKKRNKKSRSRSVSKVSNTRGARKVAKRKKSRKKAQPKSFMEKAIGRLAKPAAYVGWGFVSDKVSDKIAESKLGQQLPVSRFTDDAVKIGLAELGKKMGLRKHPIGRVAVNAIEADGWMGVGRELSDMQQEKKGGNSGSGF